MSYLSLNSDEAIGFDLKAQDYGNCAQQEAKQHCEDFWHIKCIRIRNFSSTF